MIPIKETAEGVIFGLQVVPRSSQSKVVGCQGDALKIKITAPPVEGKANEESIRFLASLLGVRKDQVHIVGGLKAKRKTVAVTGLSPEDVEAALSACLPRP